MCVAWGPHMSWASGSTVVRYPQQESPNGYPALVLKLALEESGHAFVLQPSPVSMPQGRALHQLSQGYDVDVVWTMTSKDRERALRPIRIPIDKGLLGWRLFLIDKRQAPAFANIHSLNDLKALYAGQGHDWPDTEILRANGLPVRTSTSYPALFDMLEAKRFDYYPRSVIEIWDEEKDQAAKGLVIEKNVILYYPTAFYFFVKKDNAALARAIERGLNTAIRNGKFEQLFQRTYGDILHRARVGERTRLKLTNPLLPAATPLGRKELWIQF
jgi:hypothetical protein